MAKYKKIPVIIDAIQFKGNFDKIFKWVGQWHDEDDGLGMWESDNNKKELIIATLEGEMLVSKNDYIIRGIKGEFYPCKPDIFKLTYELVNENEETNNEK